jgi:cobaltochelatase CobN
MREIKRQRVLRPDGKAINLVQRRGHLSYCYNACCCGRVDRGYPAVPVDLYKSEWLRRKLRNVVHMTKGGCLGPCTLANVVTLLFDGRSTWFHSINSDWQVLAIFDYLDSLVVADTYLAPPAELAEYVFQFYSWNGAEAATSAAAAPVLAEGIAFLTHADTDLLTLHRSLQDREIGAARVIVLRILGRPSSIPGFSELVRRAQAQGQHLLVISGAGDLNPEFAAVSTVSPAVLHEALGYLQAGGHVNLTELLHFLADHLLLTGFGFAPPAALPEHGLYHPDLPENADLADWLRRRDPTLPTVGITFYRAHWISGNTAFVDALVRELESRNVNVLPVYTASLKAVDAAAGWPLAFGFFRDENGPLIDVLVNTVSFAMSDVNPDGPTSAGWSVAALQQLDVPVLQAITSGMARGPWESSGRGLNPLDTAMNVAIPEFDGRLITVPISFKEKGREAAGYAPLPDRIERVAGLAVRFARLRHVPNAEKRIAFIFTNSNSKASQIGNAVGLDAPASLLELLHAMQADGHRADS